MRVNSALNRFFMSCTMLRCGFVIVLIFVYSEMHASSVHSGVGNLRAAEPDATPRLKAGDPAHDRDLRSKQVNILIRLIGHQLLLQSGDSSSRVLPVNEVKPGTFLLQLENQLFFSHDSLIALTQRYLPKNRFPSGYTVTVNDCFTAGIVYGFQINNSTPDILACQGRHEPVGCYSVEFTFLDFYKIAEPERSGMKKQKPAKTEVQQTAAAVDATHTDAGNTLLATESMVTHPMVNDLKSREVKASTTGYPLINIVYASVLISLGVTLVLARVSIFAKRERSHENQKAEEPDFQLPELGKFRFDVKGQRLLLENEVISLTDKECRILELLNNEFGQLVTRETLMQKIWLDEGVITGRSLDMFVSRLRKKLNGDPGLRIANVHRKGYKLETSLAELSQ